MGLERQIPRLLREKHLIYGNFTVTIIARKTSDNKINEPDDSSDPRSFGLINLKKQFTRSR